MFTHEKFIKVDFPVHEKIIETYEIIKNTLEQIARIHDKETPKFTIAGGCLSNHYMGKDFRDIDVFIEYHDWMKKEQKSIVNALGKELKTEEFEREMYEKFNVVAISTVERKDTIVECIFTNTLEHVYDFDFRFRQFYLYEGDIIAHRYAMKDADERRLILESPTTPFSTYVRGIYFQTTLDFSWDEESKEELIWFLNKEKFYEETVETFLKNKNKYSKEVREALLEDLKQYEKIETNFIYTKKENIYYEFPCEKEMFHSIISKFLCVAMHQYPVMKGVFHPEVANEIALYYTEIKDYVPKEIVEVEKYKVHLTDEEKEKVAAGLCEVFYEFFKKDRLTFMFETKVTNEMKTYYECFLKLCKEKKGLELIHFIKNYSVYYRDELMKRYEKKNMFNLNYEMNLCTNGFFLIEKSSHLDLELFYKQIKNERSVLYCMNGKSVGWLYDEKEECIGESIPGGEERKLFYKKVGEVFREKKQKQDYEIIEERTETKV